MSLAPRRATAVAAGLLALVDCTRRQEQRPVGWLKIEVLRPVTGTSGVIVLGSRKEIYWAQAGARWHKIGEGSSTTYMVMKDGAAVLFDTNTKEGLRLIVQGARRAQPVRELVGWRGGNLVVMVPPGRSALDVVDCPSPGGYRNCRQLRVFRYGFDGQLLKTFVYSLPRDDRNCAGSFRISAAASGRGASSATSSPAAAAHGPADRGAGRLNGVEGGILRMT